MTDERLIISGNGVPRPNPALPHDSPAELPEFRGDLFARRVVSYLLGQMSEEESEQFEEDCLSQENWPSQVKLVEEDLIEAYIHDELKTEERELFERNYLTTEARQEYVKVAAALLHQICARDAVVDRPVVKREGETWAARLRSFWKGSSRGLRVASALAAAVIIVGGLWLFLARVRAPRVIATLSLTSSVSNRSEGAETRPIRLPPDAEALKVSLALPAHAAPAQRYHVELDNSDGETIPLAVEGQDAQAVSVLIPTSRLPRGQYALTLIAIGDDGTEQPVSGTYFFTVE